MNTKRYFQRFASYGVIFAASFTMITGSVSPFYAYQAKAATEMQVNELKEESLKELEKVTNLLDKKELKKNFKRLVKSPRVRGTKENKAAGKYIFDTVKGYGYDVTFQDFNGYDEKLNDIHGNINKNQKKEKVLFKGRNIIVKRKNPNPKLKTVIFSARYDSRKKSIGALDNAGGTVAVMEMARILADMELPYNPEFVFFDSENLRRGSRYYVAKLSKAEKENIYGTVNINCIGNNKQRKPTFFATSDKKENPLRTQCNEYFPSVIGEQATETDAVTFEKENIPSACYFTLDFFTKSEREIGDKFVIEKDASLVDMDTLIYDTAFITTYATMLKVK